MCVCCYENVVACTAGLTAMCQVMGGVACKCVHVREAL